MTQAYVESQLQKKKYQVNAIAETLQAIENIPIIFNTNANTTEITSALFNHSNYLILPIVEKSIQLLKNHSKHLPNKTIQDVGSAFLLDLKTIVQNFENDLIDLTTQPTSMNENLEENHDKQEQQPISNPEHQLNPQTKQDQTSSVNEQSDFSLRKLTMDFKRNQTLKQWPQNTNNKPNHPEQKSTLDADLQYSSSSDDETNTSRQQEVTNNHTKNQNPTMHQKINGNKTNYNKKETIHSATKKQKLSTTKDNPETATKSQQFQCCIPHCSKNRPEKSYSTLFNLFKHIKKHQDLGTSCPIKECSEKTFNNESELLDHLKNTHVLKTIKK